MDLVPFNAVEGLHFNWTGWSVILDLLRDCGADVGRASGSNDGDLIDAVTALQWGLLLQLHLQEMIVVQTPDPLIADGIREEVRVLGKYIENPTTSSETMQRMIRAHMGEKEPEGPAPIRELNEDDRDWVTQAAEFFIKSGGFTQC